MRQRIVKNQKTREIDDYKGRREAEGSPYWGWVGKQRGTGNSEEAASGWVGEQLDLANPDRISDDGSELLELAHDVAKEKVQKIFDAVKEGVLSKNERIVFNLLTKGLTKVSIARKLNKTEQEINVYHTRIQKKLKKAL